MRWMESQWFKHLCVVVIGLFFFQSVQPMAFGFAPPQPAASVPSKRQAFPTELLKGRFENQVTQMLDRVKGQLQKLEVLPNIEELTKKQGTDEVSCAVPENNPLAASAVAPLTFSSIPNVGQGIAVSELKKAVSDEDSPLPLPFVPLRNEALKGGRGEMKSESGIQWLDWLSGLLVSEAHAQTPDPNLASTPDANTTDQFIVDKAQELGNDPTAIFAFVRDEIGYESYRGSLRGARGTLWSNAGNAVDQASLLIALLRASGIPARYVQGTLSDATSQQLILSMFPKPTRIVGCPPDDVERADPANDPQLLAETREHYWVEIDTGGGFIPADPTVPNAQLGNAFAASEGTFAEVPGSLRHKVAVRLNMEFNNSLTGGLKDPQTILNETFNTVELVGHPLSVGHFVNTVQAGGLVFTTTTHTYSPYLIIGQNDADISDDELIRGQDYQEILTNFALSSQFLTGVFVEVDVINSDGEVETHERTLFDRIGFAARQAGGTTSGEGATDGAPSLTPLDIITINVLPGLQSAEAINSLLTRLPLLQERQIVLQPQLEGLPASGPFTNEQLELIGQAVGLARDVSLVTTETLTMFYASASDIALSQLEESYMAQAHYVSPRLIFGLTQTQEEQLTIKLDLRKNDVQVIPSPGQVTKILAEQVAGLPLDKEIDLSFAFEIARGIIESTLEGEVLSAVTEQDSISFSDIFGSLDDSQNLAFVVEDNLQELENLSISEIAKARIAQAARNGKGVITPRETVMIDNIPHITWLEIDLQTGHTISVMEDGGHVSGLTYNQLLNNPGTFSAGFSLGIIVGLFTINLNFLDKLLLQVLIQNL